MKTKHCKLCGRKLYPNNKKDRCHNKVKCKARMARMTDTLETPTKSKAKEEPKATERMRQACLALGLDYFCELEVAAAMWIRCSANELLSNHRDDVVLELAG